MTGFVNSIKEDLLDRRMLPLVAVVVLALVGAIAYVELGGGGSSSSTPATVPPSAPVVASSGISVSQVSPEKAVAETPQGTAEQHHGSARNPFSPLAGTSAKTASTTSSASSSSSSSSAGTSGGSSSTPSSSSPSSGSNGASSNSGGSANGNSGGSQPSSKSPKQTAVYHVAVLFGERASGSTEASLTPYENLKLMSPLPSSGQALVVYRGVTAGGKSATFTLVSEPILHGGASCLPSGEQCEAIDLQAGQSEQLEYVSASGQPTTYELRVVSIVSAKASSAQVKSLMRGDSAGRELLAKAGLIAIPDLRYSSRPGVLVFAGHAAFSASAHHR